MNIRLKISNLLIVAALAQTSQLKTQEQYEQAKKFVQENTHALIAKYPLEYQAAKEGAAYGALAGAAKCFIPLVPKRGKGFISCACIGAVAGASANVLLHSNASNILYAKNKLVSLLQEDLILKALQVLQGSPKTESDTAKEAAIPVLTEAKKAAKEIEEAKALTEANKLVATQYAELIKVAVVSLGFIFA